jgi:hypothetical protein
MNIVILADSPDESIAVRQVKSIFKKFEANVTVYPASCDINSDIREILCSQSDCDRTENLIICRDSSISTMNSEELYKVVSYIIDNECFDVLYLANWLDYSDKQCNRRVLTSTGLTLVDTYNPHGLQCLMFSPSGQQILKNMDLVNVSDELNHAVRRCRMKALTFQPCPISFDINQAVISLDIVKTQPYADSPGIIKPEHPGGSNLIFIFIVVGIIVVLLMFIVIKFGTHLSTGYRKLVNSNVNYLY